MHLLDFLVIVARLGGTAAFGAWFSCTQHDAKGCFAGGRRVPWWAIVGSIVTTETSSVTFISIPGVAFTGNMAFLQPVMGCMPGRVAVTTVFVPAYFRGDALTVSRILRVRFGSDVERLAAGLFLIARSVADGVRLFATGFVLIGSLVTFCMGATASRVNRETAIPRP